MDSKHEPTLGLNLDLGVNYESATRIGATFEESSASNGHITSGAALVGVWEWRHACIRFMLVAHSVRMVGSRRRRIGSDSQS